MSSNSFFNQKTILNIKKAHKAFLWVATGILIISLLLGAVLIFVDMKNDVFAKVQGTFSILALVAFICVNNFIRIEKGNKLIQGFALTSFFANIVWLVMGILMIWGVFSPIQVGTSTMKTENAVIRTYDYYDELDDYDYDDYDYDYEDYDYDYEEDDGYGNSNMSNNYRNVTYPTSYVPTSYNISIVAKILIVVVGIASIGFWVSNILAIKDRVGAVKALKVVAIVCQVFSSVFVIVLAFAWPITLDGNTIKWIELYGLITSGFIVMALAAWIISITHKDFNVAPAVEKPQDEKPIEAPVIESVVETEKIEEIIEMPTEENHDGVESVKDKPAEEEHHDEVEGAEEKPMEENHDGVESTEEKPMEENHDVAEGVEEKPAEEVFDETEKTEEAVPTTDAPEENKTPENDDSSFEGFSNNGEN